MNDLREEIEKSLENTRKLYEQVYENTLVKSYYHGVIVAYEGVLKSLEDKNLIPAPRTEQDILNDFEKLGWKVTQNDDGFIILCFNSIARIVILKQTKTYHINGATNMQEHKLLNELFALWGWL